MAEPYTHIMLHRVGGWIFALYNMQTALMSHEKNFNFGSCILADSNNFSEAMLRRNWSQKVYFLSSQTDRRTCTWNIARSKYWPSHDRDHANIILRTGCVIMS